MQGDNVTHVKILNIYDKQLGGKWKETDLMVCMDTNTYHYIHEEININVRTLNFSYSNRSNRTKKKKKRSTYSKLGPIPERVWKKAFMILIPKILELSICVAADTREARPLFPTRLTPQPLLRHPTLCPWHCNRTWEFSQTSWISFSFFSFLLAHSISILSTQRYFLAFL